MCIRLFCATTQTQWTRGCRASQRAKVQYPLDLSGRQGDARVVSRTTTTATVAVLLCPSTSQLDRRIQLVQLHVTLVSPVCTASAAVACRARTNLDASTGATRGDVVALAGNTVPQVHIMHDARPLLQRRVRHCPPILQCAAFPGTLHERRRGTDTASAGGAEGVATRVAHRLPSQGVEACRGGRVLTAVVAVEDGCATGVRAWATMCVVVAVHACTRQAQVPHLPSTFNSCALAA